MQGFRRAARRAARLPRLPDIVWAPVVTALLLLVSGALSLLLRQPWLFPSLGPSSYLHAYHTENPASRFYNTVFGHFSGIVAGYLAVFLCGAQTAPPVMSTEHLTSPRLWASILAVALTVLYQLRWKAFHPPALATTLLISLGAFRWGGKEIRALVVGVLIVAVVGEIAKRLRVRLLPPRPGGPNSPG